MRMEQERLHVTAKEGQTPHSRVSNERASKPAAQPRILLVEDDRELAEVISLILNRHWPNHEIRFNGIQGILALVNDPFDLVITDLQMEAGDGLAMIEAFRRQSSAPVIIVTGHSPGYADRVRFLDNVAVINKPFDSQMLLDLVEISLNLNSSGTCEGWNIPPIKRNTA